MYSPLKTVKKAVTPGIAIIGGATLIDAIGRLTGNEVNREFALGLCTSLYGVFRGIKNFFKNRKK